jgi:RES domain-containing protein
VASRVQRVSVAGSWWRQTPYGSDPLWLASPPSTGRWQHGNKLAAIYLADEEPTAWAEWYRGIAELGLPPTRRNWLPFQTVGEQLHSEGYRGVLYPSAARPDRQALCLFREGIVIPGADPVRPPTTHRDPPAPPTGMRT